MKFNIGRGGIH